MISMSQDRPVTIRRYEANDRHAVRQICCDTADRGAPIDRWFQDREIFADLVTRYYTDEEPESVWIAEQGGVVVGYLTGCRDSRRYQRVMQWRVVPATIGKAIARGALWSGQSWRLVYMRLQAWVRGALHRRGFLRRYPAHFHVNLQRPFRGRHLGRQLVEQFLAQLRTAGVQGVHVVVRADNVASCRFFERMQFTELSRHETVIYGKPL